MVERLIRRLAAALVWVFAAAGCAPASAQSTSAVEYFHAGWGHYFVTSLASEISALDAGAFGGVWQRTGQSFPVGAQEASGTSAMCRFFSTSFSPRSSHFYTHTECDTLRRNADWQFEAIAFHVFATDAGGSCRAGTVPLYRLYNNARSGAPNHRYTTSRSIVDAMHAQGWTSEGSGPDVTFACVQGGGAPPPAPVTAAGVWVGTTSLGESVRAIVLSNGIYYFLYTLPGSTTESGVFHGRASVAADGSFTSSDGNRYRISPSGASAPITLSGTLTPRGPLQATITESGGAVRTLSAAFVPQSDQPPGLEPGLYQGFSGHGPGRLVATATVTAAGTLTGSNEVCRFAAPLTPRSDAAVFDWIVSTTSAADCIFGSGPISGVLYFDAATHRIVGLVPMPSGRPDMWYLLGTR